MNKPLTAQHSEWLSLVEVSGPFLTLPVLKRALPMGLDPTPLPLVDDLRVAWKEVGDDESLTPRWIRWVLSDLLELPDEVLKEGTAIGPAFTYTVPEHSVRLRPDFIVVDPDASSDAPARLLVTLLPAGTDLDERLPDSKWSADAVDRMAELCRGTRVRLGLVTNGNQWALVDAPLAGPTGLATWDANLWLEERITLDAFTTLLGVRRFFSVAPEDTLEAMLAESANAEAEVTDQLGKQVRQAVELLVDAMSRANRDRGGHLFDDLTAEQVYEAAVTVMMRLVFLLSAEERGLFLLGDETYDSAYAVSTLRGQIQEEANTYGEEVIARRTDAWHRLLATFRMVYGGAQHENLRLPAYGGSLFDPDRFPILEGRKADEPWRSSPSHPLPIDNRTVLHILGAIQVLTFKDRRGVKEARRLSFRALDVEQIGHVYEGLLDHSAVRVDEVAVGLGGKKDPEVALAVLETEAMKGRSHLVEYLAGLTGLSNKAVDKALRVQPEPLSVERLTSACDNDHDLAERVAPYLGLMRLDLADLPTVYLAESMYVTQSSDRRSSGTYYTPRALAEELVLHALEPLVYAPGPAEGVDPAPENLKSSTDLLDLKICDMAMGSGAFLVATCRYLSSRLLEAWRNEGLEAGDAISLPGRGSTLMPLDEADREILARRLVADSCLYGVDRNPMAVEMAKLSMWLITLAKDRPFTFVDHALRCGDSLLGISDLRQLDCLHLDPAEGRRIHGGSLFDPGAVIQPLVEAALDSRRRLESFPVLDVTDAVEKRRLLADATQLMKRLMTIGDAIVGAALSSGSGSGTSFDDRLTALAPEVTSALDPERDAADRDQRIFDLELKASFWLDTDRPPGSPERLCFHWPLEFPEVFAEDRVGFDALVGNPPFLGGTRISGAYGKAYQEYLGRHLARSRTDRADLVSMFFLRASQISSSMGLIATNTLSQGDTRDASLGVLLAAEWTVYRAVKSMPWPNDASLEIAKVWMTRGPWAGALTLADGQVAWIGPSLDSSTRSSRQPGQLLENTGLYSEGVKPLGQGFLVSPEKAEELIASDPKNADVLFPYLNGRDLNEDPFQTPSRWIINFFDWPEERARTYPLCFEIVESLVKPERTRTKENGDFQLRSPLPQRWWQYAEKRKALYDRLQGLSHALAIVRHTPFPLPLRVPAQVVFSEALAVFPFDSYGWFGLLSSGLHYAWAVEHSSTLGGEANLRYTGSKVFATLPRPCSEDSDAWRRIGEVGRRLDCDRNDMMRASGTGLTKVYNRLHDPSDMDPSVRNLRDLHIELDVAVRNSYGWEEIPLDHQFVSTPQGERFTFAPQARERILDLLLELNLQQCTDQESDRMRKARSSRRGESRAVGGPTLFERDGDR